MKARSALGAEAVKPMVLPQTASIERSFEHQLCVVCVDRQASIDVVHPDAVVVVRNSDRGLMAMTVRLPVNIYM